jgi:hypothetical protein
MMVDDDTYGMYDTDGFEPPTTDDGFKLSSTVKGMMLEIDVNGHKVNVINPEYVQDMQRLIYDLSERLKVLDRTVRTLVFTNRNQQRLISNLQNQLDGKIDRE